MTTTTTKQTKVIKRYANRKLYDTERSCYVTLEEISQMIKEGDDVKVIDNKTRDDLTAVTLAQIIVEEEKKVQKMPLQLLRSIIQSGNEMFEKKVADPVKNLRDDVESRVNALLKRDARKDGEAKSDDGVTEEAGDDAKDAKDAKDGVVKEFVHSTQEAFETWQKRIDERVREAMSKIPGGGSKPDLDGLRARVDELEARIKEVEARKKS